MSKTSSSLSSSAASSKSVIKPAAEKPRKKPSHPPSSEMVIAAIKALDERGGSSLSAIKKYIADIYDINIERQAIFIRKYLRSAVEAETLIQTAGKGANGSFKFPNNNSGYSKSKSKRDNAEREVQKKDSKKLSKKNSAPVLKKARTLEKTDSKKSLKQNPKKTSSKTDQVKNSRVKETANAPKKLRLSKGKENAALKNKNMKKAATAKS